MAEFQNIVMSVAIVILIITLCILGVVIYNNRFSNLYPPVLPSCPDYWDISGTTGSAFVCKANALNKPNILSDSSCNTVDGYNLSKCAALQTAATCGFVWDGITNNPNLCSKQLYPDNNCECN